MFKALKLNSIIFVAVMFIFTLSFSALQACVVIPGKSCCSEPCEDEACPMKEAKAKLTKVSCGLCEDTEKSGNAEDVAQHAADVVLNIRGMTCAGSEGRVKDALSTCEGVSDVKVSYKDGKAHLHVEEGKVDKAVLIEALKQVGFLASEG
jgi:copper chaperone CopZ